MKKFYCCCVGLLVLCSNKTDAANMLENILLLLLSKKIGHVEGRNTLSQDRLNILQRKLTGIEASLDVTTEEGEYFITSFYMFNLLCECKEFSTLYFRKIN